MPLTHPVFGLIILVWAAFLAWSVTRLSCFFRHETSSSDGGRYETLDGLRGFLALGVFLTHVVLSFRWYETGKWGGVDAGVYGNLGKYAVASFFMITGFLFWGKIIRSQGRPSWKALYISRFRRLVPLYLFSVGLVLAVVTVKTGFQLQVGLFALAKQIASWLTFSLIEPMNVNGLPHTERINAGVLWTLAYEWKFYASLPLLAFMLTWTRFLLLVLATLAYVWTHPEQFIVIYFLFGMLAAYSLQTKWPAIALDSKVFSLLAIILLMTVIGLDHHMPSIVISLMLFLVFLTIVHGNTLFGILVRPWAKYLGIVSYSTYLLHGIVLYTGISLLNRATPVQELPPHVYWSYISLLTVVLVLFSGLTYRFVEHPFLKKRSRS